MALPKVSAVMPVPSEMKNRAIWHGVLLGDLNFRPQVFESAGAIVNLLPAYNDAIEPNLVTRLADKNSNNKSERLREHGRSV
jgi:hypothetical protein